MSSRSWLMLRRVLWAVLALATVSLSRGVQAQEAKAIPAFERVPKDGLFFLHVRVSDVLKSDVAKEVLTGLGKQLDGMLKRLQDDVGFSILDLDQFTIWQPKLSDDGGQEIGMIFQTNKPYDADSLKKFWATTSTPVDPKQPAKKEELPANTIPIRGNFVLHLTDNRTFAMMHKSLLQNYLAPKEVKVKPLQAAFDAVAAKHSVVVGVDFSGLPAEVFNDDNVFFRPFHPLLKDNRGIFIADIGKNIEAKIELNCKSAEHATDALRSWNLLMQLATDGIDFVLKDKQAEKEAGFAFPFFKETQTAIKSMKSKTEGATMHVAASFRGDLAYSKLAEGMFKLLFGVTEASQDAQSSNNMKQIAIALHNYADTHGGFPPQAICDKKGKPLLSWRVAILPYIEQENVYRQFKLDEPWDSEHNLKLAEVHIKTYMLPGEKIDKQGKTPYRCFYGNGAAFDRIAMTKFSDFQDGTSNTIFFVEAAESVVWTKPDDIEFNPKKEMKGFLRASRERFTLAFADGSVRRTPATLKESVLKLLIQKNDGMAIPNFDE